MSGYAISVFLICLSVGVCLSLRYGRSGGESLALGIILLSVVISPIADGLMDFGGEGIFDKIEIPDGVDQEGIDSVIEEAFAEGIRRAVAEKFSLDGDNIRIRLYDFDRDSLTAGRIRIILSGGAAFADYKAVEKYIDGLGVGECDVEIELGQGHSRLSFGG